MWSFQNVGASHFFLRNKDPPPLLNNIMAATRKTDDEIDWEQKQAKLAEFKKRLANAANRHHRRETNYYKKKVAETTEACGKAWCKLRGITDTVYASSAGHRAAATSRPQTGGVIGEIDPKTGLSIMYPQMITHKMTPTQIRRMRNIARRDALRTRKQPKRNVCGKKKAKRSVAPLVNTN